MTPGHTTHVTCCYQLVKRKHGCFFCWGGVPAALKVHLLGKERMVVWLTYIFFLKQIWNILEGNPTKTCLYIHSTGISPMFNRKNASSNCPCWNFRMKTWRCINSCQILITPPVSTWFLQQQTKPKNNRNTGPAGCWDWTVGTRKNPPGGGDQSFFIGISVFTFRTAETMWSRGLVGCYMGSNNSLVLHAMKY